MCITDSNHELHECSSCIHKEVDADEEPCVDCSSDEVDCHWEPTCAEK